METKKLYQQNVYQKEAELTVTDVQPIDNGIKAAFESTIFYPEGGGQLCDTGFIGGLRVSDVHEKDGIIWHVIQGGTLEIGKTYHAELDWERRFKYMQMHCGEHILSGIFHKLYNAENRGFHMGEDYVTIDILCPTGDMDENMITAAERKANEAVWRNEPVNTIWFETSEEAMSLPVRKAIKFAQNISVVLIGPESDPTDCCACCGTHPAFTGEVGLIKITHSEKYKGMQRFYVKCGAKAYEEFSLRQKITDELGLKYSCEPTDIIKSVVAEEKRNEEVYKKYASLKGHCINEAVDELKEALKQPKEKSIREFSFNQFDPDDLQLIARKLESDIKDTVVFKNERSYTCILASPGDPNCGSLVKDYAPMYKGKGGGKPAIARAIFADKDNMELFIDLIEKHLR